MRLVQRAKWKDIQGKVRNIQGKRPKSEHVVKNAVQRVQASGKKGVAATNFKNCGCKKILPQKKKRKLQTMCKNGGKSCSAPATTSKRS